MALKNEEISMEEANTVRYINKAKKGRLQSLQKPISYGPELPEPFKTLLTLQDRGGKFMKLKPVLKCLGTNTFHLLIITQ